MPHCTSSPSTKIKKFYIHFCIESTSNIFTFLTSFCFPPSTISDLPLAWPVFHNIACICIGPIFHIWQFYSFWWRTQISWYFEIILYIFWHFWELPTKCYSTLNSLLRVFETMQGLWIWAVGSPKGWIVAENF
jgi:hypothetical protein